MSKLITCIGFSTPLFKYVFVTLTQVTHYGQEVSHRVLHLLLQYLLPGV